MFLDIIYFPLILLSLPYIVFTILAKKKFRVGLGQRLGFIKKRDGDKPCIWIHGSSVGEIMTGRKLINEIEKEFPHFDIVVSSWTNTGVETAKRNFKNKFVFFFPLDVGPVVNRVFKKIRPTYLIFIELEIWPNFFIMTEKLKIPTILVNGRISEKSVRFYRRVGFFSKSFYNSIVRNKIYLARSELDADRFAKLSVPLENIKITGTMKYDNIKVEVDEPSKKALMELFCVDNGDLVLVGGSTHDGEEEMLINVFASLKEEIKGLRLILVPRHIERANDVISLIKSMGFAAFKKSSLNMDGSLRKFNKSKDCIVVVDTVGELIDVYSLADCVFVGRSLVPKGGQNMMEPAGLAKPIIFGPHTFNFEEESKLLLENDAARLVNNPEELLCAVRYLLLNHAPAMEMGLRAQTVVSKNRGATDTNLEIIKRYFKSEVNLN